MLVEIDDVTFWRAMVADLRESVKSFEESLNEDCPNVFVWDDPKTDKTVIQEHIDAFNLVIDWYKEP